MNIRGKVDSRKTSRAIRRAGVRAPFARPLCIERLEDRSLLSVSLTLAETQNILGGTNLNVSSDYNVQPLNQSEMSLDMIDVRLDTMLSIIVADACYAWRLRSAQPEPPPSRGGAKNAGIRPSRMVC